MADPITEKEWMTSSEVAQLLRVSPKTVTRWAKAGLLPFRRTLGGHRRYSRARVLALIEEQDISPTSSS